MNMISIACLALIACSWLVIFISQKYFCDDTRKLKFSISLTLIISSFLFVLYANWIFACILLIVCVISYLSVSWKEKTRNRSISIGICLLVFVLGYFKYANFFISSFKDAFGIKNDYVFNIVLPLGISFYIFSAISYIVDAKKDRIEKRNFLDTCLYISFFPKLTSGPIQRSKDFFIQIDNYPILNGSELLLGFQIFCFGLFKKLVLADHLSVFVDEVYATPLAFNSATIILAVVSYSLQIYFDFSGYSDIAIGCANMLGIKLPKNFNLPYLAHNVTEFWKRWHITLSSWLQDYVYISLGGNRKGNFRTYINLLLTMVIGGLWHGANWTFVFWGFVHGLALVIHKVYIKFFGIRESNIVVRTINTTITFIFISFTWIFFRSDSFGTALIILKRIFMWKEGLNQMYLWSFMSMAVLFISSIVAYYKSKKNDSIIVKKNQSKVQGFYPIQNLTTINGLTVFFVFCGLILGYAHTGGSPFIYGGF